MQETTGNHLVTLAELRHGNSWSHLRPQTSHAFDHSRPNPLQEALRDSAASGTFIGAKFWVFSKHGFKRGRIGGPKALFVNGHVTKRVLRLDPVRLPSEVVQVPN